MDESLKAQLQATLDMIPAFTWLAASSGALLFVNSRCADYLGLPKDHPLTRIPNVTLSAHSAFRTPEASENLIRAAWEHCRRIAKG